ncbi:chitooligosaccharidolytic beta-N-acetylglucosaminidase isoform X2 [Cimex lectularius]|nr:chitooligosaccharidolytic beta-N-acetylglucosaminidase isoform X2 [Cimex lectularius]XP_014253587.1 chitooligosaccharidolytic beta-N-acetylglucosaminidase isoform X2 [Cimex lectularius]XP_024081891.1 chitooligosaccharidolytic beta-N-acetylglucosaminidase isoform X2 [Cimex lectularius]
MSPVGLCTFVFLLAVAHVLSGTTDITVEGLNLTKDKLASLESEVWTWECEKTGCVKKRNEKTKNPFDGSICTSDTIYRRPLSVNVCKLLCPPGTLWPKPTGLVDLSSKLYPINPNSVYLKTHFVDGKGDKTKESGELVEKAGKLFNERLRQKSKNVQVPGKNTEITFSLKDPTVFKFTQNSNESYALYVNLTFDGAINITIEADNFLGARHGLETLDQVIVFDHLTGALLIPGEVKILDKPMYTHRGIMLDTARNFLSVDSIKRTLEGMALNKLNTFHWHITDSHSFPFQSTSYPELSKYGAYSQEQVYTVDDIKNILEYARVRGIRVIPEFDAPAHVGEGWQFASDENVTVCFKAEPWTQYCVEPPCGQLNPTSEKMYTILEGIYNDMGKVFDSDLFHMGGDEVNFNCWRSSDVIVENMTKMGLNTTENDFLKLWSDFQTRALGLLEKVNKNQKKVVLWTSTLTEHNVEKYLNNSKYIIQIWTKGNDHTIKQLVEKGYPIILSNYDALYLDCGFGAWIGSGNNWCSPYIPWQKIYENDPVTLLKGLNVSVDEGVRKLILGAEATLWTEQADDSSIDNRIWPRSSAMAELLWTGPGSWNKAEPRYLHQRERMVKRKISADTVQPQWCYQNQGKCY